jgi:hypoxanthine phosphoribosyltransferase
MEVDWPFFGELCRALALKTFREYDPEIVIGIAKAGAVPGAVVASILQRDFASITIARDREGGAARPASWPASGCCWWTKPAIPARR